MKHIKVVIGANFGDEGKGMLTHYFSKNSKGKVLNVLYNGGCQRGHTVMNHVFHCFGSGYFDGADTYYHTHFMVDPIACAMECIQLGKIPNLYINPLCRVVTPYDIAINQAIEKQRGENKHGSCGMGIWETDLRSKTHPIFYADLYDELNLYSKLKEIKEEYCPNRLKELNLDLNLNHISLDDFFVTCHLMTAHCANIGFIKDNPLFDEKYSTIVFEGGQGLLLDEENKEMFPHVTASSTGSRYISKLIDSLYNNKKYEIELCYVTRSYMTKHGAGWMPYETTKDELNPMITDNTNVHNEWQDSLRYGKIHLKDLIKRIEKDKSYYSVPVNTSIAVTHMNYSGGKMFTTEGLKTVEPIFDNFKYKTYKFFDEYK